MEYNCPHCSFLIKVDHPDIVHAGFSDCGFMYCTKSGDLLSWNTYDVGYTALIPEKYPWTLSDDEKRKVENAVIDCPCGGKFRFSAKPRCPHCNKEIPDILPDSIHWVRLKNHIDGEKQNAWKTQ